MVFIAIPAVIWQNVYCRSVAICVPGSTRKMVYGIDGAGKPARVADIGVWTLAKIEFIGSTELVQSGLFAGNWWSPLLLLLRALAHEHSPHC